MNITEKKEILNEVCKWGKEKEEDFSKKAKEKCKHYLYKSKDVTPQGYGKWMRDVWNNSSWKNLLESHYEIKLCGIHYISPSFEKPVILAPIATHKIENTLQAYSETFLRLSPYKSHFAHIMMEKEIEKPCHFRLGGRRNQSNRGSEDFICYITTELLDFFQKNFKVCHLSVSLKNIYKNSSSEKAELKVLKKDLRSMELLEENDESDSYLKSIIISFYTTLTVLKESERKELFNANESVDAVFIPINVVGMNAVVPSLHSKHITLDEIKFLKEIYAEIFRYFILWEQSVVTMPKVKKKLQAKFPALSEVLEKLEDSIKAGMSSAAGTEVENAKKLLQEYIKRGDL